MIDLNALRQDAEEKAAWNERVYTEFPSPGFSKSIMLSPERVLHLLDRLAKAEREGNGGTSLEQAEAKAQIEVLEDRYAMVMGALKMPADAPPVRALAAIGLLRAEIDAYRSESHEFKMVEDFREFMGDLSEEIVEVVRRGCMLGYKHGYRDGVRRGQEEA